jgi:hypothetical protein
LLGVGEAAYWQQLEVSTSMGGVFLVWGELEENANSILRRTFVYKPACAIRKPPYLKEVCFTTKTQ